MISQGFTRVRSEVIDLKPVPAVCVLGVRAPTSRVEIAAPDSESEILVYNAGKECTNSSISARLDFYTGSTSPSLRRHASRAMRKFIALFMLIPALAIGGAVAQPGPGSDFYITVTSDDLYLCGEGFGGLYGCIDEAISREANSVVISASSDASVHAVQEIISAVHAVGFEQVGVATLQDSDS